MHNTLLVVSLVIMAVTYCPEKGSEVVINWIFKWMVKPVLWHMKIFWYLVSNAMRIGDEPDRTWMFIFGVLAYVNVMWCGSNSRWLNEAMKELADIAEGKYST